MIYTLRTCGHAYRDVNSVTTTLAKRCPCCLLKTRQMQLADAALHLFTQHGIVCMVVVHP